MIQAAQKKHPSWEYGWAVDQSDESRGGYSMATVMNFSDKPLYIIL